MSGDAAPPSDGRTHRRHLYRLALSVTLLLVLVVIGMLPFAIRSMQDVLGRGADPRFDLITGRPVNPAAAASAKTESIYANVGIVDIDETTDQATLVVSGNRTCASVCWAVNLTLASLDDDADERQGLPPSATIKLTPNDHIYSQSVQLPMQGKPSLYPFDEYRLWLGVGGEATTPDGQRVEISPSLLGRHHAVVTLQNRVPDMIMADPVAIPPERVRVASDPFGLLAVQAVTFERPAYLKVLAVALVLLIAISATLAVFTRGLDELALGFGGLVLGVWGIRSVLMPQSIGTVTVIDLALSWLILLLLLGLALRALRHFHRHSELPWSQPRRPAG